MSSRAPLPSKRVDSGQIEVEAEVNAERKGYAVLSVFDLHLMYKFGVLYKMMPHVCIQATMLASATFPSWSVETILLHKRFDGTGLGYVRLRASHAIPE